VGYTEKVVVVGAGISGLACAYRLKQLGIRSLVLEADDRPGGVIGTIRHDGFLFETGPQGPRFPAPVWQLVRELNLESEFVYGDKKAARYIFRNGTLHQAPFSPGGLLTTRLVGTRAKVRVLAEAFRSSRPPITEESLSEFVERKFGREILDNLVDPFVSTVFFGDSEKIGMQSAFPPLVEWERKHGSLVRGAIRAAKSKSKTANANGDKPKLHVTESLPTLGSFQSGMARLTEKLADELKDEIRYKAKMIDLERAANGSWRIGTSTGESIFAEHLVFATPAFAASGVLQALFPELAALLSAIEYAPMTVIGLAYDRAQVANPLRGFGFMVPRNEGMHTICTFWNSSLFPHRAPAGKVAMTSFVRHGDKIRSQNEVIERVKEENARILGIQGSPVAQVVWTDERALPQYNVGHADRVCEIDQALRASPNLHLVGNYLKGRSIGDCVEVAFGVAEDVQRQLQRNSHLTSTYARGAQS
jgi:protoporphyrinogen/coproporphyrinogen III oxidase